jgi:hypothetical protein
VNSTAPEITKLREPGSPKTRHPVVLDLRHIDLLDLALVVEGICGTIWPNQNRNRLAEP